MGAKVPSLKISLCSFLKLLDNFENYSLFFPEAFRQLADTKFYPKVNRDLTQTNQKIVKDTVNKLILEQKLPSTARNLFVTTPKTSTFYLKPKIHKPNNPGRPIISACSCPTELISSFLDGDVHGKEEFVVAWETKLF